VSTVLFLDKDWGSLHFLVSTQNHKNLRSTIKRISRRLAKMLSFLQILKFSQGGSFNEDLF
jgi:hypothetical protein